MSQIQGKFVLPNAITDLILRLRSNNPLRSRNNAGTADLNILKTDASDIVQLLLQTQIATAPSAANDVANKTYVDTAVSGTTINRNKENKTLSSGDITNQYIDLAHPIKASSLDFMVNGVIFNETVDYTVNLTGGAGGVTRVTFAGDLATGGAAALVSGDVVYVKYDY